MISVDYTYKEDLQASCLSRNIIMDYAESIIEAIEMLEQTDYCLVVIHIDIMNNTKNLKIIQKMREMPILLLSSTKSDDKISILQNGSQVFVITSYSVNYLNEKCTVLSNYYSHRKSDIIYTSPTILTYDDLTILVETHQVFLKGKRIMLTKQEFELLEYFMTNIGFVLTYEQIYNYVWKDDNSFNSNNLLHSLIRRLRDKLKDKPNSNNYIISIWGTGYKFGA